MNGYSTIKDTADRWKVSVRWVQELCAQGKIDGAVKFGHAWAIPDDAERPEDNRIKSGQYKGWREKSRTSGKVG